MYQAWLPWSKPAAGWSVWRHQGWCEASWSVLSQSLWRGRCDSPRHLPVPGLQPESCTAAPEPGQHTDGEYRETWTLDANETSPLFSPKQNQSRCLWRRSTRCNAVHSSFTQTNFAVTGETNTLHRKALAWRELRRYDDRIPSDFTSQSLVVTG